MRSPVLAGALVLSTLALVAGCGAAPAPAGPQGSVRWTACGSGFECATLPVPLDHADPAGPALDLSLIRLPASSPGDRRGSLVTNPGGPGVSGVDFVRLAGPDHFGIEVRSRFDIVGFDPRGVGRSTAVDCGDESLFDASGTAFPPGTDAERTALADATRRAATTCEERSGDLLRHIATADAARDLELLRVALGEERLTYYGASYGTFLGATYAALHPDRVGAMVLDAPLDPAAWQSGSGELARDSTVGFDRALRAFFDGCRADPSACAFGDGDPRGAFDRLVAALDRAPLPGDPPLDGARAVVATAGALYDTRLWPPLADALARAERGDGATLARLAGPGGALVDDAFAVIRCSDRSDSPDLAAAEVLARDLARVNPHFGPLYAHVDTACAFLPPAAARYDGPYSAEGAPPILVVGTTGDPATPIEHARALASTLSSARLLVRDGDGHGAYGLDNPCVDGAVDAYLLDATLPPAGLVCGR